MTTPTVQPGESLSWVLETCEVHCSPGCCLWDAYRFHPVLLAARFVDMGPSYRDDAIARLRADIAADFERFEDMALDRTSDGVVFPGHLGRTDFATLRAVHGQITAALDAIPAVIAFGTKAIGG